MLTSNLRRVIVATVLLLVAIAWIAVEIGPPGPLLLNLPRHHGIDARDLAVVIPLIFAALILRPIWRTSGRNRNR